MPPKAPKSSNAAYQTLKGDIASGTLGKLYLFHGEEAYLRDHYLGMMKQKLLSDGMESFNYHTLSGKGVSVQALGDLVDTLPMMSARTLVVVYDYDLFKGSEEDRRQLAALFSELPDYCCLVFIYDIIAYKSDARMKQLAGAIKAYGSVVKFERQSQGDLTDWIHRRFKSLGHSIDTADAQYLIFLCGDLMHGLLSEIEKIGAYAKHPRVTREDIDAVAIAQLDAVVFQMTDALTQKDYDKAFSVLGDLLHMQQAPMMILSVLGKHFRQLLTARLAFDHGRQTDYLVSLWSMRSTYPAQKLMGAARRFSPQWCRRAVLRCAQTDLAMKSLVGADPEALLVNLLLELSAKEGAYAAH